METEVKVGRGQSPQKDVSQTEDDRILREETACSSECEQRLGIRIWRLEGLRE